MRNPRSASPAGLLLVYLRSKVVRRPLRKRTFGSVLQSDIQHGIVQGSSHEELKTEVVDTLGIAIRLSLLRLVPIENQAVSEGQASGGVSRLLIAVEDAASERGLNMTDNLLLEVFLGAESRRLVALPSLALGLRNGGLREWLARSREENASLSHEVSMKGSPYYRLGSHKD